MLTIKMCFRLSSGTVELALTQESLSSKEALLSDLEAKLQESTQSCQKKSESVHSCLSIYLAVLPVSRLATSCLSVNYFLSFCL